MTSEETRQHLQDAHRRVMSVAAVQKYLHSSVHGEMIEIAPYLTTLCGSLAESMIGESGAKLEVIADSGKVLSSDGYIDFARDFHSTDAYGQLILGACCDDDRFGAMLGKIAKPKP